MADKATGMVVNSVTAEVDQTIASHRVHRTAVAKPETRADPKGKAVDRHSGHRVIPDQVGLLATRHDQVEARATVASATLVLVLTETTNKKSPDVSSGDFLFFDAA